MMQNGQLNCTQKILPAIYFVVSAVVFLGAIPNMQFAPGGLGVHLTYFDLMLNIEIFAGSIAFVFLAYVIYGL